MIQKHASALTESLERAAHMARLVTQDASLLAAFERSVETIVESLKKGGRLYVAGNGGSAADAQHLAAELVGKLGRMRGPIPAEALTVDTSALTAIANDFGYDQVFSRQLEGKASGGDVFLALSTSGRSPNIVRALETAKRLGVKTILMTGPKPGEATPLADLVLAAPGETASEIQQVHIVMYHSLCGCLEDAIFPRDGVSRETHLTGSFEGHA